MRDASLRTWRAVDERLLCHPRPHLHLLLRTDGTALSKRCHKDYPESTVVPNLYSQLQL